LGVFKSIEQLAPLWLRRKQGAQVCAGVFLFLDLKSTSTAMSFGDCKRQQSSGGRDYWSGFEVRAKKKKLVFQKIQEENPRRGKAAHGAIDLRIFIWANQGKNFFF